MKSHHLIAAAFILVASRGASAFTYDAVNDCNGTANPSGAWSYLGSASVATAPTLLVPSGQLNGNAQEDVYYNNVGFPSSVAVTRNFGPGTISYATVVLPTTLLRMDPQSQVADVRFTVPSAGSYAISGLFQIIDTAPHAHEVQVLRDYSAVQPLFASILAAPTFGQQIPFSFADTYAAGETIDFIVNSTGDASFLSTGLSATITSSLPESPAWLPATAALIPLARRRQR